MPKLVTNLVNQLQGTNIVFANRIPPYVAYILALEVQAYRQYNKEVNQNNFGDGFYYILDASNRLASMDFVKQQPSSGTYALGHSEVILADSMTGVLSNGLRKTNNCNVPNGGHLYFVIYSQITVCSDCLIRIAQDENTMSGMLQTGAVGAKITVTAWSAVNQTRPIVMYPGTVVYSKDIKRDY